MAQTSTRDTLQQPNFFCSFDDSEDSATMSDPMLAQMMAANLKKQKERAAQTEEVVEASGDVAAGQKPKPKKKPPPGAQQIGMQAMLLQEATQKGIKLKTAPKQWGVQQPTLADLKNKSNH
jgi:hypothetical protein